MVRMKRGLVLLALCALAAAAVAAQQPAAGMPQAASATFNRDVAPILHKHCTTCHRPGQSAPMSLLTYEAARPWARAVLKQVTSRTMPPWGADPAIGHFANDPSLTRDEIETIARWVDGGAPKGDTPLPPPPTYSDEWKIGTPDLIVQMDKPFPVPASGLVEYQFFQIPTHLTEDTWIQAIEVRPGDPRVVHHLRVFAQPPGTDTRKPAKPGETLCLDEVCGNLEPPLIGYGPNIVSIAVGTQPDVYPPGSAKRLKAGSMLSLHMHYTTMGVATTDQTRIGFVFAKQPPAVELKTVSMAQENFVIPPGAPNHLVQATVDFKEDVLLHSLGPHSHLRGKSWAFELKQPDGSRTALLSVPRFDFNWQLNYVFASPVPVPAGSRLIGKAVYDNSPGNKFNPDPTAAVGWGNLTVQEMMFASVVYSRAKHEGSKPR
jgi:mono/diheme cytochrome c family protein